MPADLASSNNGQILGSIAMSSQGTLCFATTGASSSGVGSLGTGGSLWWVRENAGRGNFNVVGRFSLYSAFQTVANPTSVPYNAVLEDVDPLRNLIPGPLASAPMQNWSWAGPPSVLGNQLVATATAHKGGSAGIPVTVVMAFNAEPQTPEIHAINFPLGFSLAQPDVDRNGGFPGPPVVPTTISTLTQGAFNYDATTGTIQIPNLATVTRGQITDCLTESMPILVRGGAGDTLYEPESFGEVWTPMEWYCVYEGLTTQTPPLITGNTVFIGGSSSVPGILATGTVSSPNAVIDAMDVTISPSDLFMTQPPDRAWENQVEQISGTGASLNADPHIRMPSAVGVRNISDYTTRVLQTVVGNSTSIEGLAGGGDTVAAWQRGRLRPWPRRLLDLRQRTRAEGRLERKRSCSLGNHRELRTGRRRIRGQRKAVDASQPRLCPERHRDAHHGHRLGSRDPNRRNRRRKSGRCTSSSSIQRAFRTASRRASLLRLRRRRTRSRTRTTSTRVK